MRKEYFSKGAVSTRHKHVRLLLLNSSGRLILQRRSKWKGDNAGLWDKTIGGHVSADESDDLTVLKECAQELAIPATIVREKEFDGAVATTNLNVLAILKRLANLDNYQSKRKDPDGRVWVEPSPSIFYMGYYDGAMQFVDSESCGLQVFSLDELEGEIRKNPEAFTDDIKFMIKKFRGQIKPIKNRYTIILSD